MEDVKKALLLLMGKFITSFFKYNYKSSGRFSHGNVRWNED